MNVWKLTKADTVSCIEVGSPAPEEGKLRVRVGKVYLGGVDEDLFRGKIKPVYPIVPGRFAVGKVADENPHPLFKKGTRVLLHTLRPEPYAGTARREFTEEDYAVCGQTRDGFLSDFVLCSPDDMTPLPDSVSDDGALTAHLVGLGRAAIERLDLQRGQHVAVIGANLLGILICQLLIYQQAAPILIDTDPEALAFARTCGIYYTLQSDDSLMENVGNITGGRLASGAIFVVDGTKNDHDDLFRVCGQEANTVVCSLSPADASFNLDLALKKQLTVHCVWLSSADLESAINLIATHAVDLAPFVPLYTHPEGVEELFKKGLSDEKAGTVHIVDLI